ncbi:N-formylglutamate amidohydrolase [Govanella unica]|uniref:N-formylglutamate amidohydrolase n=1 Tax=Govanella unica TaxID=2975056 RepID=A0A9X3TZW5_9PROT|nr:N-formylglutamate amidohydrolase [Govania unica]MDA5194878.1 N-formylglutamate amidohydrolase [Govania unica]
MTNNDTTELLNPAGSYPLLLICDHASRHVPPDLGNLGLSDGELDRHIGWDIGAAALTRLLSAHFDAPAVLARTSRLVIDVNRELTSDSLIPANSDGTDIPGNRDLSLAARRDRIDRFYHPFHAVVEAQIKAMTLTKAVPLVIGVHSFTPVMNGIRRPWVAGLLWNRDPRLAQAMIRGLRKRGHMTGDNEPYSGQHLFYTMDRHGSAHGLPQATLEIRQDQISTDDGIAHWAAIIAEVISEIAGDPALGHRSHY